MHLNKLIKESHQIALDHGFWTVSQNIPEKLMLIVTEVSEACEAHRHNKTEDFNEEIADTFIRLADLCGYLNIDIEYEIKKKTSINKERPYLHGKEY